MAIRPQPLSSHSALSCYKPLAPLALWQLFFYLSPGLWEFPGSGIPWSPAMSNPLEGVGKEQRELLLAGPLTFDQH